MGRKPTMAGAIVSSYDNINGGIDVNIQSQTNPLFQYFLMNELKTDITLTSAIAENATVINVSASHGFTGVAGEVMVVRSGDAFFQMAVVGVATNAITVEMPTDLAFPITASVLRGSILMNVNGSSTPVDFEYTTDKNGGVTPQIPVDLQSVVITMQHSVAGDDSLFGGIGALTNGFYFRKLNGSFLNFGNYKNNQKFRDFGAVVNYTDKAGGGNHAIDITFDLVKTFGQEVRLNPRTVDAVLGKVRDNITLLKFTVSLLGSLTSGE